MTAFMRATHPYSFRSGQWAEILGLTAIEAGDGLRPCFIIRFPDGQEDLIPADDSAEPPRYRHGPEFLMAPDGQLTVPWPHD